MKAFIEGQIVSVESNTFKDAQTQNDVKFNTYFIKGAEGGMITLNSREDFEDMMLKNAVLTVDVRPDPVKPSQFKIKIIDVKAV